MLPLVQILLSISQTHFDTQGSLSFLEQGRVRKSRLMGQKMRLFALGVLLVAQFWSNTNGDEEIVCTRTGPICTDCHTLGYCEKDLYFNKTRELKCPPGLVCDEWSLKCVRNGICRYKPTSCPMTAGLIPDPYSCRTYIDCSIPYTYNCIPGKYFSNSTCANSTNYVKVCDDYPVICQEEGSKHILDGCFIFECTKEDNVLYPKFIRNECSSTSPRPTDETTEVTTRNTDYPSPTTQESSEPDTSTSEAISTTTGLTTITDHESSTSEPESTTTEVTPSGTTSDETTSTDEMTASEITTVTEHESSTSEPESTTTKTTTTPPPFK